MNKIDYDVVRVYICPYCQKKYRVDNFILKCIESHENRRDMHYELYWHKVDMGELVKKHGNHADQKKLECY